MHENLFWRTYRRIVRRHEAKAEARMRLERIFRGTLYVDLLIRRNGRWEHEEGDFLKVFIR